MCSFAGEVVLVVQRLDARYDWLPSPHNLINKHSRFNIAFYGNACSFLPEWEEVETDQVDDEEEKHKKQKNKVVEGRIALVSSGGCSSFTKVIKIQFNYYCYYKLFLTFSAGSPLHTLFSVDDR